MGGFRICLCFISLPKLSLEIYNFLETAFHTYRAAAFDVTSRKQLQYPPFHSILFVRLQGKKGVSSKVILENKQLGTNQVLLCQLSL